MTAANDNWHIVRTRTRVRRRYILRRTLWQKLADWIGGCRW